MYSIKQKVELNHLWSKKGHNDFQRFVADSGSSPLRYNQLVMWMPALGCENIMKKIKKFIKIIFTVIGFFLVMVLISLFLDRAIPLDYELINSMQSPDNSMMLYIYSVNGGATSDYSYRLAISANKNFDEINKDNFFFQFDTNHGSASKNIEVEWDDLLCIKIIYDKNIRVFRQKKQN